MLVSVTWFWEQKWSFFQHLVTGICSGKRYVLGEIWIEFLNIIWSNFSFEDRNYGFVSASLKKLNFVAFRIFHFYVSDLARRWKQKFPPQCWYPTVIPSFRIKLTLRLSFEDSLFRCLYMCLRLKFILPIAYINFKHCHILCCLDL